MLVENRRSAKEREVDEWLGQVALPTDEHQAGRYSDNKMDEGAVPEHYPRLIDAVTDSSNTGGDVYDEELTFGLDVIFDGLAARISGS